jgi:antitoxin CcdA
MSQNALFDENARKRPTNLSINSDLLRLARAANLNLSKLLEERLKNKLREIEREKWLQENTEAIDNYNRRVARRGVFSDGLRRF